MNRKTNTHGEHQEIHIGVFKRDRIGIVSGTVERHRKEAFDTIDWSYLAVLAAPALGGVPCVNVVRNYDEKQGMAIYSYSYEGVNDEYQFSETETTYELDISMSEDPIETHVNFAALKKKYGWNTIKRRFNEFMPGSGATTGTGLSASTTKNVLSDLFGTDSYLAVGAHYKISYARGFIPAAATARTNEIVKNPRGIERFQLPGWARRRNWLCLGPHATHRGNACQISEEYLLSGPRGWNKDVYGAGKLGGSGSDPGCRMGKHSSRLFAGLNTRLRRMPGRDFIRFEGRAQSFDGAWALELQGISAATIAPGTINKVMPKIKGVDLDEVTPPVLRFPKLTLDTDGRGFICAEVTFNAGDDVMAADLWSIRTIEMVQVANPDTDDGLPGTGLNTTGGALPLSGNRARWPVAMLRLRRTGVLDVIQGEFFPLQHRVALKEDRRSASRHFFW